MKAPDLFLSAASFELDFHYFTTSLFFGDGDTTCVFGIEGRICRALCEVLFGKFERGSREGTIGGIGLGLAICRSIIELHGGKIRADERQPHGAVVRMTLPLARLAVADGHDD